MENNDLKRSLTSDATHALVVGTKVFVNALSADGKPYVFTRKQMEFFLNLQKLKDTTAAALAINETEEWANRFLASKKFKSFISAKMQELSIKSGVTVEWWYQFGKNLTEGQKTFYNGFCNACNSQNEFNEYEVEMSRDDDMTLNALCHKCEAPVDVQKMMEVFKPTREQVEGWKELGSRIIPKVDRIQHQFSNEQIEFQSEVSP